MVSPDWEQLRFLLAVPRADREACGGARGDQASACGCGEEGCEESQTRCQEDGQGKEQEEVSGEITEAPEGEGASDLIEIFVCVR